jgi:type II secretory pathway pseudopilin PulG
MRSNSLRLGCRGFSLIELAISMVILMTMLTMGITAFSVQRENAAVSITKKRQDLIQDALSAYLGKYRRLPCPDVLDASLNVVGRGDDNRATPDDVTTQCSKDFGVVPYIDLGLTHESVLDGWENYITYRVTTDVLPTLDWTRSTNFAAGKPGKLIVSLRSPATSPTPLTLTGTENAVVVLVSHGKNGLGAWTIQGTLNIAAATNTDEAENSDADTNFVFIRREQTDLNIATYGAYDDLVSYAKASDLIAPLIKDGSLRSPEGETTRVMDDIVNRIIGNSMITHALPDPSTYPMPNDGWGMPLIYARILAVPLVAGTPTGTAFTVRSYGPNRVLDASGDDVITTRDADDLKTLYAKAGIPL